MTTPRSLRRARGADTKALILDAARDALATDGYAQTTTRSIAERAGVQLSLVHYHFEGKQQLLAEVLTRENDRLLERQRELFAGPGSVADNLPWTSSCAFTPRCPNAIETCRQQTPPLVEDYGRALRCFNPVEVSR